MVDKAKADVLLAGLSESVQGFTPLPNVPDELGTVEDIFGGVLLENQEFSYTNMNGALERKPYPLIHMATHAQFKGRSNDTFLLMWDERMNLDELQRLIGLGEFRKQPVELLVLSACQTAVGDEQAALGLAGVAVKAGARSALASLWFVNDESTSLMVAEFYKHYKKPGVSKSRALRAAQLEMIRDLRYRHPGYWAPFLLIGNWL
jgi:CHAT domain-containing protein